MLSFLYKLLEYPPWYKFSQFLLAPGGQAALIKIVRSSTTMDNCEKALLDVGCGPASWLWRVGLKPVGLDISLPYSKAYLQAGGHAVNGSATLLPFADASFGTVFSLGMFHHLPDSMAHESLAEMLRVCVSGGKVVILDAVMPRNPWLRPLAYVIRKMDRGQYMRSMDEVCDLLPPSCSWSIKRYTYAFTGLEMAVCVAQKDETGHP